MLERGQGARERLADDVHVTVTQAMMPSTDTVGIDKYMEGLVRFADTFVSGSAKIVASTGDYRNAMLMVIVKAMLGPYGAQVSRPAARLYLLDEDGKIRTEQVIFTTLSS